MPDSSRFAGLRKEVRPLLLTTILIVIVSMVILGIVWTTGLTRGSVLYLIPVIIAATRWGIVPSLYAAAAGVVCSAFFFFPPLYSFRIRDPQEFINLILFVFVAIVVSQLATR
ncbi:MAG: DUF4118 domain-containing protein, partial [Pseudolabrys sp.]|nr:DUF4118 domain-containing protein [Pseudolabrys sp.]